MPDSVPNDDGPGLAGCTVALVVGPAVVAAQVLAFTWLTGRPLDLDAEAGVLLFQAAVVAAPFLLLSLVGTRDKIPWLVAALLTLGFWGYLLFDGVRYHWTGDTSGANIGLGLLMLVSPLLISGAAMGLYAWRRERRRRKSAR